MACQPLLTPAMEFGTLVRLVAKYVISGGTTPQPHYSGSIARFWNTCTLLLKFLRRYNAVRAKSLCTVSSSDPFPFLAAKGEKRLKKIPTARLTVRSKPPDAHFGTGPAPRI